MKRIPYGIINYKKLIENNYYYVDKTMYLEKLENVSDIVFYLRPGRFGKSLFTSMMYYYYDINSKDLFDNLFKDTYVYNNPTKEKNSYYILNFDFSGIASANKNNDELANLFKSKVLYGLKDFNNYYGTNIIINEDNNASELIANFILDFESLNLNKKIYILIDEYDNFTNAILEGDADRFRSVVGNEGVIKAFYAVIKQCIGLDKIGRFFATGICPITLDSMTTGFNIAEDISTDIRFNSMIGLTHDEVKKLLNEIVEEKDRKEIYELMIKNYDGYLFNVDAENKVFNATLVMYLLNYYESFKKIPNELMDKNIATNYGKIGSLLRLKNNSYYKEILNELLKTNNITGNLVNNFNLLVNLNKNDLISLLYYFGYLTIKEESFSGIRFMIPNEVMREAYNSYFIKLLSDIDIKIDNSLQEDIIKELVEEGKINKLSKYVEEILKLSDNKIFIKFDEKYVQVIYFCLLMKSNFFDIYTEYPTNNGYIDIYLQSKNNLMKNNIMIELKYIKKKDYSDKLLKEKIKEGKDELLKYSQDKRLNNPCKYLVVFVGKKLKLLDEVI